MDLRFLWTWWRRRPTDRPRHLLTGEWGEAQAERFLSAKGMAVIGRRVRAGRRGEIDLVVRDGGVLVFVEVKTRADESFGRPMDAVDRDKRRALSRAALRFLRARRWPRIPFRFDVVEIVGSEGGEIPVLRHIPNAFPLSARYRVP